MAKKASSDDGKGSGSQDKTKTPPEGEGAAAGEDEDEEEEEEETPPKTPPKEDGEDDPKLDLESMTPEARAYIKKLRRENAKYRTKAANISQNYEQLQARVKKVAGGNDDGDDIPIEKRVEQLESTSQGALFDNAILTAAVENNIDKSGLKYFRYLVAEKVSELGEGEELGPEELAEIAEEARKTVSGGKRGLAKTSVTNSDDDDDGGKKPGSKGKITIDQFIAMTVAQKSDLQKANPEQYIALFNEARNSRKFY